MRKLNLRMNELFKYDIIKELVETNGNKKNDTIKLEDEGKVGFIHKNRGRKPASTISDDIKNKVIILYRTKSSGANLLHFAHLLPMIFIRCIKSLKK